MFGGEEVSVKLQFDNSLVNVVIDRFSKDVSLEKVDENSFAVQTHVDASSAFLSWVFQFGDKVKVLSPGYVVDKYKEMLQNTINQY